MLGSGLHPRPWENKGDVVTIITTNLIGLYGVAEVSGVKRQSLWRVVCASSDMFSDFLQGPITLVGPLVKAFLLPCQIYSGLSAFQSLTTLPGTGCWLVFQVCLGWHFLSDHCSRKLVPALKPDFRSMCWTVHFTQHRMDRVTEGHLLWNCWTIRAVTYIPVSLGDSRWSVGILRLLTCPLALIHLCHSGPWRSSVLGISLHSWIPVYKSFPFLGSLLTCAVERASLPQRTIM